MNTTFYYGVIEDRNDPQKLGRVRVRVFGIHSAKKSDIATPDLPWAQVIVPTTSAGFSGFGQSQGLVEGSFVVLYFKDGENCQEPIIFGAIQGINDPQMFETGEDFGMIGFMDPRQLSKGDYEGTYDGPNSQNWPNRTFGLEGDINTSPVLPESVTIDFGSKQGKPESDWANEIKNPKITKEDLPYYPLKPFRSAGDNSGFQTGDADYSALLDGGTLPSTKANPRYPYNKSWLTESGHLFELDDTRDAERILLYHRSGTYTEIQPDGDNHTRIVKNDYELICGHKEVTVCGDVNVTIKGNAKIQVSGTTDIISGGDMKLIAPNLKLN